MAFRQARYAAKSHIPISEGVSVLPHPSAVLSTLSDPPALHRSCPIEFKVAGNGLFMLHLVGNDLNVMGEDGHDATAVIAQNGLHFIVQVAPLVLIRLNPRLKE